MEDSEAGTAQVKTLLSQRNGARPAGKDHAAGADMEAAPEKSYDLCYIEDFPIASDAVQAAMDTFRSALGTEAAKPVYYI